MTTIYENKEALINILIMLPLDDLYATFSTNSYLSKVFRNNKYLWIQRLIYHYGFDSDNPFLDPMNINFDRSINFEDIENFISTKVSLQDAFERACARGNISVVKVLLNDDRINPSERNNFPLKIAHFNGHRDIVNLLLSDGRVSKIKTDYNILELGPPNYYKVDLNPFNRGIPSLLQMRDIAQSLGLTIISRDKLTLLTDIRNYLKYY